MLTASQAALDVGDRLRTAFHARPAVEHKSSFHDPVTVHDREAERSIRSRILAAYPDSLICGEEGGEHGGGHDPGRLRWYIDPIDGTANFARGLPFFCVSIGAALGNEMVAGVVYDPLREELFSAFDDGAFLNDEPIRSMGARTDAEAFLIASYPSYRDVDGPNAQAALAHFHAMLHAVGTLRRPGSAALTLAYVAAGRVDAAIGTSVHAWDVAGALCLVRHAGGIYRPLLEQTRTGEEWTAPGYLAAVGTYDLDSSVLNDIARTID
jgi:myo-inositol-1(or 4)-monophosphatase